MGDIEWGQRLHCSPLGYHGQLQTISLGILGGIYWFHELSLCASFDVARDYVEC